MVLEMKIETLNVMLYFHYLAFISPIEKSIQDEFESPLRKLALYQVLLKLIG